MFNMFQKSNNLISVGRLDDEGYIVSIRNGVMKFCKGNLIVA